MSKNRARRTQKEPSRERVVATQHQSTPGLLSYAWWLIPSLCAMIVWGDALQNGFVWDDRTLVLENSKLSQAGAVIRAFVEDFWSTELGEGRTNYYRPLVTISYIFDRAVYGTQPWGYHLTNIGIHSLNCFLLLFLLIQVRIPRVIALISASLCAIHPAFGETVAWVSGRTDSLALCWILVTLVASRCEATSKGYATRWSWIGTVSFAFALCSKEFAIVTPLVMYFLGKAAGNKRPAVLAAAPRYLLILLGWFAVRAMVLRGSVALRNTSGVGFFDGTIFLLHTLGNLLWPPTFRVEYGAGLQIQDVMGGAVLGTLTLGFLVWGTLQSPEKRRKGEPYLVPPLCLAALALLIPSTLTVLVKSVIGARLVYASAFFIIPALVVVANRACSARVMTVGSLLLGLALGFQSMERARLWRSDITLFERALAAPHPSTRVHLNLGIALYDAGRLKEAAEQLERPMEAAAQDQQAYMLGLFATLIGCEQDAERHYKASLALNPANLSSITNLIGMYATQGRREEISRLLDAMKRQFPNRRAFIADVEKRVRPNEHASERSPVERSWCASKERIEEFLNSAAAIDARGVELATEGQTEMAGILFSAAYVLDSHSEPIASHYADNLLRRAQRMKAREIALNLLLRNPRSEVARALLARIANDTT